MALIELHGVEKRHKHQRRLKHIDLQIDRGECVALIGANGAGKSTLINAIFDLTPIDSGHILLAGIPHRNSVARRGFTYLPERFSPPYYLRGRHYLHYICALAGVPQDNNKLLQLCQEMALPPPTLDQTIHTYSKGMAQKLGLIGSFLCGQQALILDEPMTGLDIASRAVLKSKLLDLSEKGRSVFFTTHALNDLPAWCDRIGIFDDGALIFIGTPAELCADGNIEAAYLSRIGKQ